MKVGIIFSVPGEPVPQSRPRFTARSGFVRAYEKKDITDYKRTVAEHAKQAYGWEPIAGAVKLQVDVYKGMPKSFTRKQRVEALSHERLPTGKPDTDNYLKGVKDALNGICYVDDSQVVEETVRKFYSDEPRVEITVTEV